MEKLDEVKKNLKKQDFEVEILTGLRRDDEKQL